MSIINLIIKWHILGFSVDIRYAECGFTFLMHEAVHYSFVQISIKN